ncbi:hypothetical protein PoB_004308500 [Plakobranchus ocellatus]|uniref:Uncharacterized protein n=1 Tax=Plakobranchus ocellatus TaxID=259542 RepID=A0AAV4BAM9_9GAST|nr:hypothetical protein PoB_004308500 [Plakobranchus ocellatus]
MVANRPPYSKTMGAGGDDQHPQPQYAPPPGTGYAPPPGEGYGPSQPYSPPMSSPMPGFQAFRQSRVPDAMAGLGPATEGSLQIYARVRYPLGHPRLPAC